MKSRFLNCFSASINMATQIGAVNRSTNGRVSSPNQPRGTSAILNFGARKLGSVSTFVCPFDHDENGDESMDDFFNQPEKKRRLSMDQVQFLEKCFIADNKLEPDRKIRIAKQLGLQPRQITIWFQNRRARWKTRQLETDYEALHRNYQSLKTEYDNLVNEHEKLKFEVLCLRTTGSDESILHTQRIGSNPRPLFPDHDVCEDDQASRAQSSLGNDVICAESLLFSDHPSREDEFMQPGYVVSKVEVSHYLPNVSSGFYFGFPIEDPSFSF